MTAPVVHALVIVGLMCGLFGVTALLVCAAEEHDKDDDGCIARAVLFGLAAEGLVAAVVWAVLR